MIFFGLLLCLVFACIRTRKKIKPVGVASRLWKCPHQAITDGAASQRERASERSSVGKYSATARAAGDRAITPRLVTLAALSLPALVLLALAYIQTRPNTAGIAAPSPFDGERAFGDLKTLVSFGPRPSGSPALARAREFTIAELRAAGAGVTEDTFIAETPIGPIQMTNIVAKIPGTSPSIVIIGGHYDTKRMNFPFVGANDGGSSAAFLLEMARVLAHRRDELTYWVVFFDGEEAVQRWSATDSLYGSRHLAAEVAADGDQRNIEALILVDMVADTALDIHRDTNSTRWPQDLVFNQARRLGYGRYFSDGSQTIEDDHLPFVEIGIPAVDIIDLDYGPFNLYWHTRYDTVSRCSSASLNTIGNVVLATLAAVEATGIKGAKIVSLRGSQALRDVNRQRPVFEKPTARSCEADRSPTVSVSLVPNPCSLRDAGHFIGTGCVRS